MLLYKFKKNNNLKFKTYYSFKNNNLKFKTYYIPLLYYKYVLSKVSHTTYPIESM